jgi:hypothetical protein
MPQPAIAPAVPRVHVVDLTTDAGSATAYDIEPMPRSGASTVTAQHGTPPDLLRCELAAIGYRQTDRLHAAQSPGRPGVAERD